MQGVLKGFELVPPSFEVLSELAAQLSSPYADLSSIEFLISRDAGLSLSILKLANSAYFGCHESVDTVSQAVGRIGIAELTKLVAMIARRTLFTHPLRCYGVSLDEAWSDSLATAIVMEYLACWADEEAGVAYMTGLMHSVGKYAISRFLARVKPGAVAPAGADASALAKWERATLGSDHPKVGGQLLTAWRFPVTITEPICNYLHPYLAPTQGRMAALLHIAVRTAPYLRVDDAEIEDDLGIQPGVFTLAGVDEERVRSGLSPARVWYKAAGSLLQELQAQPA